MAARVLRGESAGALLDGMTGAATQQAVQKQAQPPGQQTAGQGQRTTSQGVQAGQAQQVAGPAPQAVDVNALIAALTLTAPTLGTAANTLDIAAALTWIESVQQALRAAIQGQDALPEEHADRARLAGERGLCARLELPAEGSTR